MTGSRAKMTARTDLRLQADARRFERLARAKRALMLRADAALIQQIFELSPTDMKRLAGRVRAERG